LLNVDLRSDVVFTLQGHQAPRREFLILQDSLVWNSLFPRPASARKSKGSQGRAKSQGESNRDKGRAKEERRSQGRARVSKEGKARRRTKDFQGRETSQIRAKEEPENRLGEARKCQGIGAGWELKVRGRC